MDSTLFRESPLARAYLAFASQVKPGAEPEVEKKPSRSGLLRWPGGGQQPISDDHLLELFHRQPERAWKIFLERYAGRMIGQLHALGLERDDAMDCFVFSCELLARDNFRRLREVRETGQRGELVPWLRQVVKNSAIDWGWTQHGRRRLFRSVEALDELDQRVFQLHFWSGLGPAAILETLRAEGRREIDSEAVFDALERVLGSLDAGQKWRLLSQLTQRRPERPIAVEESDSVWEPASHEPDPEQLLLGAEQRHVVDGALGELAARDRMIFRLRYQDSLSLSEIAAIAGLGLTTVKTSLRGSRAAIRAAFEELAS